MIDKNTTHLAGEFLVAGELSRRGYPVAITFGNAKSVDIYATTQQGEIKIDAKAGRTKSNFPISKSSVDEKMYYIFVYLQSKNKIYANISPEYFIATGHEILKNNLIVTWRTRQGIRYSNLNTNEYKGNWDKIPSP